MAAEGTPRPPVRIVSPRGGRLRGLRAWAARTTAPAEPWLADHPWRREGALDEAARGARLALLAGGLCVAVGSGAGVVMLPQAEGVGLAVAAVVTGAFLAAGFWLFGVGVLSVLRRQRHGVAELRFSRFPYLLGEPLDATLVRDGALVPLTGLHARLTCVEEYWGQPSHLDHDQPRTSTHERLRRRDGWSETRPVPGGGGGRVPIHFDLPRGGPGVAGTRLSAALPRYWELELWAELPGLDFHAVFLVPVYQRPGVTARPPPSPAS